MSLSDLSCRNCKPKSEAYRLYDEHGLYLDVRPTGKRIWRMKYRFEGKEKLLTIGHYPKVGLGSAREQRDNARQMILNGGDPATAKQEQKKRDLIVASQTFEFIAIEWHTRFYDTWDEKYAKHIISRLRLNVFPIIGKQPISTLTAQQVFLCVQKVEERGKNDLARRVLQIIGQIIRHAVITGRAERDITSDLKGALKKYKRGHYAAIEADELPQLLKTLDKNDIRLFRQTILAIRLMLLTFVRTSELINATWDEFDFENGMWNIPAERMKMRIAHVVPLSPQVVEILNELKERYGADGYILPSVVKCNRPISNNTILKALSRLGYYKKMTGHGFRALAMSTIKEKLGYRHEVVDRQLAHLPRNKIDQAYDRAKFIPDRIQMMNDWADYIDKLKEVTNGNVKDRLGNRELNSSKVILRTSYHGNIEYNTLGTSTHTPLYRIHKD